MKTLFDQAVYEEITGRIRKISENTTRGWGKMEPAQMLAHCCEAMEMAIGDKKLPRSVMGRILGPMIKKSFLRDTPFKQNNPTAKQFIITDKRELEKEKQRLLTLTKRFHEGGEKNATKHPHGFFGHLTQKQWGEMQWKHLDHHLRQFGV
ncbi:MAG: DUF1569 domain-containing protein [Bacteroidetes bacterium]|nr:DUF1569 domain-containing protein [Bacteroidota bacterium]